MIPPSIILIIYGVIAQVSISQLFLGGVVAGLMTAAGYIVVVLIRVWLNPALAPERDQSVTLREKFAALRQTWPILLIMIGIFGGLFGGVFTPTEAGAIGAFMACVVAIFMREMTLDRFMQAARETLMTTAALLIIAIGASLLTRFLALSGAGDFLSSGILSIASDPVMLMVGIVCVYLLMGMFLEPIGAMLLTLPIILPVVDAAGWSLLWFGIVLTKLLEIGMITPPIGMNVFVIKSVVGDLVKTSAIFRGVFWFIVMDLILVAILCAFPQLVLTLPALLG
jgi:tripartite ATP-independent transporter DctM subunit